jgi:hypothetical protein
VRSTGLKSRPVGPISATGPVFPLSRYGIICVNDFPENKTMSATTETLGFQAEETASAIMIRSPLHRVFHERSRTSMPPTLRRGALHGALSGPMPTCGLRLSGQAGAHRRIGQRIACRARGDQHIAPSPNGHAQFFAAPPEIRRRTRTDRPIRWALPSFIVADRHARRRAGFC